MNTHRRHAVALFISFLAGASLFAADNKPLFTATPLTEIDSFTRGVEGPACDAAGNIYAVNFGAQQTIGRVTPEGKAEVFVTLPGKSVGNGIRFSRSRRMARWRKSVCSNNFPTSASTACAAMSMATYTSRVMAKAPWQK